MFRDEWKKCGTNQSAVILWRAAGMIQWMSLYTNNCCVDCGSNPT